MNRLILFIVALLAGGAWAQTNAPVTSPDPMVQSSDTQPQPLPPSEPPPMAPGQSAQPPAFFYYCEKSRAYYPSVTNCDAGWVAVPVGPAIPVRHWNFGPVATEETVRSQPNVISLELFGRALIYSLDFDRTVTKHISLGIGISSWKSTDWWHDYSATVTVVPVYADYYFSERPRRGFISAGVDWIGVSSAGYNNSTFTNNGFAGVVGGGYESRDASGFILRLGGFIIAGRSATLNPMVNVGYGF